MDREQVKTIAIAGAGGNIKLGDECSLTLQKW